MKQKLAVWNKSNFSVFVGKTPDFGSLKSLFWLIVLWSESFLNAACQTLLVNSYKVKYNKLIIQMVGFSYIGILEIILPNQHQTALEEKTKPRKSQKLLLYEIKGNLC